MSPERIWLNSYPQNVPADMSTPEYTTLNDLFESRFSQFSNQTAQTFMKRNFSYGQIDKASRQIASYLQCIGLVKGDRVAVMLPNIPQYAVIATAVLRAGYVLVNVNPLYTANELKHQLNDAQVKAIFIIQNFAHTLVEVIKETPIEHTITTGVGDMMGLVKGLAIHFYLKHKGQIPAYNLPQAISFKQALKIGNRLLDQYKKSDISPDDIAILQYTGGTTGVSKGAVLLHRNLVANVHQLYNWIAPALANISQNEQTTIVGALPLYHIFAFAINLLMAFHIGGKTILIANPKDINRLIDDLKLQRFHIFPAVNTLFNTLVNHPRAKEVDWHSLRLSVGGGMPVQNATSQAWFKLTGCPLIEGYGMSETSPVISAHRVDLYDQAIQKTGIGYPMPSTEIMLVNDQDEAVPLNTPGELVIKGPQVMAGYWNQPEETIKVFTKDGFLRTGDIAVMDETGWLRIVDRKKDMILVSGFNVYPNEIEDAVALLDGVKECVALGLPDPKTGETVALMVVKKDSNLTKEQIKQWCKEHLTGYKRPRVIEFCDELPKSTVGKILRREVRNNLISRMQKV